MLFPNNEGSWFLYNVGTYLPDCKTSHVKRQHSSLKKCGLIGTEIIQRFPTVAIESTARHNESNPWSYWIPFFFKKNFTSFLPFSLPSLTTLYILYNKLVKTFDRNPGFSVVAFIFFVTQFLTRALQTVYRLSVTRLKLRLQYFKNQSFEDCETEVFVGSRPHQFLIFFAYFKDLCTMRFKLFLALYDLKNRGRHLL